MWSLDFSGRTRQDAISEDATVAFFKSVFVKRFDSCSLAKLPVSSTVECRRKKHFAKKKSSTRAPQRTECPAGRVASDQNPDPLPFGCSVCCSNKKKKEMRSMKLFAAAAGAFAFGESCTALSSSFSSGCRNLQASAAVCSRPDSPLFPQPVSNTICSLVQLETVAPAHGSDLPAPRPCRPNPGCDVSGTCGTSNEFCARGTAGQAPSPPQPVARPGCIYNCGAKTVGQLGRLSTSQRN